MLESKVDADQMAQAWAYIIQMKKAIIGMLRSENDGVRTHCIKFLEMVIVCHSVKPDRKVGIEVNNCRY